MVENRAAILLTGTLVGYAMVMPNVYIGVAFGRDQKTVGAACFAVGLSASLAFLVGGIAGCILNSWLYLLPGLFLQTLLFSVLAITSAHTSAQPSEAVYPDDGAILAK